MPLYKTFNTKEEASMNADNRRIETEPTGFCPLIDRTCVKKCVCIVKPYSVEKDSFDWDCGNSSMMMDW